MTDNENDDQQNYADRVQFLDHLWEKYFISRKPKHLAEYLAQGGEVDEQIRTILIDILENGPPSGTGNRDNERDVETYVAVEKIRFAPIRGVIAHLDDDEPLPEKVTLDAAWADYAQSVGAEESTIISQYRRGKKFAPPQKK